MPKELQESKFQIDKVTVKINFCVLRWPDIKTWIQTVIKTRKRGQVSVCVCVICHNQHCTDQKDQLLQLYLVREIVTRALLCCHLWPVWLYHSFPHYPIMVRFSEENLLNIKFVS